AEARAVRVGAGLPSSEAGRETTGYRLVHGEGDGLPGLVVDVFDDVLVVQLGTIGLKLRERVIVDALVELLAPRAILDRTPRTLARSEGMDEDGPELRALHGEIPDTLTFSELGLRHEIPIALAQKTGFYFDQRPLREYLARVGRGATVLDAFCYAGAIGLAAAKGGASRVLGVDKSVSAVLAAAASAERNGLQAVTEFEEIDANLAFKRAAAEGGYDIVVCDPPKLATGRKARDKALGAYRKLAAGAVLAVKPGGLLAFCSCSGIVGPDALQRALALGARDAQRRAIVVERLYQGADHPVAAAFPEGLYLKVLVARILES
ncbi:MAG: class I SAM-dependent rRNA methyltransferase, partial [Deltaproteobacteria bacterium]|nr:class I SAM-dependent rRNA methyltransferase [Deltaproteobacteria bacterium]